jgi:hypothetical protein
LSPFTDKPVPAKRLPTLTRLGVEVVPTRLEETYNADNSAQGPTGRVFGVRRRVRRRMGYDGFRR